MKYKIIIRIKKKINLKNILKMKIKKLQNKIKMTNKKKLKK